MGLFDRRSDRRRSRRKEGDAAVPSAPPADGLSTLGADHFAAVGLSFMEDGPGMYDRAQHGPVDAEGGSIGIFRDPSGAGMSFATIRKPDGDAMLACAAPFFTAETVWQVRVVGAAPDPECRFCDGLQIELLYEDGSVATPVVIQLVGAGSVERRLPVDGTVAPMRVTAVVERLDRWGSVEAHVASQEGEVKFASRSAIPTGLFGGQPSPYALVTGEVVRVDRLTNHTSGHPFGRILVDSFPGRWELVARAADLPLDLVPGHVVRAETWLVGEPVDPAATSSS